MRSNSFGCFTRRDHDSGTRHSIARSLRQKLKPSVFAGLLLIFIYTDLQLIYMYAQSLDLTDLDWSPELWIASYDNDQQNARIAQHIWEENGLDVPEPFFVDLQHFLG